MRKITTNKLLQAFDFNIAKGDFNKGAVGSYNVPINIPVNAIVTAIWIDTLADYTTAGGGQISIGTTSDINHFLIATAFDTVFNGFEGFPVNITPDDPLGLGIIVGSRNQIGWKMDNSPNIVLTISVAPYTTGSAAIYFEYYYPQ